ncbi:hypothetical protein MACJ_003718 [Theileria orientalis]|uniref:Uncharacterized protein n=1 Tax=Theileria orientalis TaxID=68886 RepID=A0A976SLK5_THEOR|nr:hypothetical protein MACJ_003718 [Theileria orientalis]
MRNIYTFVTYLLFSFFIQKIICLDLNIGNIRDYSSGSTDVTVKKITEIQNLYTHEFSGPLSLKDIYNGDKKIYFDPLLVKDQLLLSASVIWLFRKPLVIQLNLEKSSVLLLNEEDSTLDVQAIFSEKLVTNLSPRIHPNNDKVVDVNLSKTIDYDIDNSKVYVTNLEFSEDRFKRYTLRNYNLDSTKLGKILYNGTELKTKTENDSERATESNLVIPYKDNIYSILVYAYNDFPLLIEVLYTFNKRQFYGYTDDKKWHQVLFPAYHDPSFSDFLYNKLNYYACKNGFKYTIDIKKKTASADNSYQIDNYCIGSEGVETVPNNLKLAFYDDKNEQRTHRCYEHTPSNNNKFFIDHLMVDTSLLKLPNMPNIIKCARVYYQSNAKPQLIVLVDNSDVLHYYINRNEVWNEFKKEENVKFDERFNDSIRASLDNVAPTVQVDEGSIVVLTDRKTSYNKEQITNDLKNNLSSDFFDNEITVKENTNDKGSCLSESGYKVYMHDLSSAASIFSHSSGSNIQFLFYVSNTKIGLYESTKVNGDPLSLAYDKQNDLYVYFYREYPKALAVCYNGKLYRPYNSEEYTKKWVHVKQVNDCCCKSGSNQRNKALSDALFNVMELFNLVNPYEQTRDKTEYTNSSLFFEYTHRRPNSQQAHNIQVCKKSDCGKILKLTYGTEYSKCPLDKALVYFNRYYTNEKPLIISLHFGNSGETRYYEPSVIHDSPDADSSKPLIELNKYTNHSDFVKALLEKNDTLFTTVTYQIDKKDNSYNDKRVTVADETSTVKKLNDNKFAKYVHSPTSGNTEKKSFILHQSNILKTWNTSDQTYEPLDKVQNIVYKSVTVYFSTGLDTPLLVGLLKTDDAIDYYYIVKEGALTFWNQLDVSNYQKLLSETITTDVKIHDKLIASDCDKLLEILKKIEASLINAVIVLLSKQTTYNKEEMERGLRRSYPKPIDVTELTESQPDSITVTRQDYSNLKSLNFECYIQKINPIGPFKTDLRIMVPSYEDYRNVLLHRTEPDVAYRSKIIFDLDQREHRTYYDAEKYYVNVQKKEFTNPPYIRYAHTCVSCGKLSEGEFTIKFDNIGVNFSNDIPETEQKRFDVYFHKSYPEKFSTVVFHQPGSNKPRYFGYSNFVEYHKNNKNMPRQ